MFYKCVSRKNRSCNRLLFWIFSAFDVEAFLIDDNRTQWIYVIDRAYGDLFRTDKMPTYDFFVLWLTDISILAFLAATGTSTVINFIGQKFFVFTKKGDTE